MIRGRDSAAVVVVLALAATAGAAAAGAELHGSGLSSSSAGCDGTRLCLTGTIEGELFPGAPPSRLPVTFSNRLSTPIRVSSLTISLTNPFPAGCPASEFEASDLRLTGQPPRATLTFPTPLIVPAASSGRAGAVTYPATLALLSARGNQDACQGLRLAIRLSAGSG